MTDIAFAMVISDPRKCMISENTNWNNRLQSKAEIEREESPPGVILGKIEVTNQKILSVCWDSLLERSQ